jgi:hypothetical protein
VRIPTSAFRASLAAACLGACVSNPPVRIHELAVRDHAGCAIDLPDPIPPVDVAIAIDASQSSRDPSGVDVDGNGRIGRWENSVMTDPADSLLSAQVAAVRSVLRSVPWADTRFAIVAFRGRQSIPIHDHSGIVTWNQAVVVAPLTPVSAGPRSLEDALDRLLARGSLGTTQFSAGMRRALGTLGKRPAAAAPRRVVVMISDSAEPVMVRVSSDEEKAYDPLMRMAAEQAIDAGVRIHTLGLGIASTAKTPHSLSRIAGATGGTFQPVIDPENLHCHLLRALLR